MAHWAYGLGILAGVLAIGTVVTAACLPDLAPNLCGNGVIDPGEKCDTGGIPNPGCSTSCQLICPPGPSSDGGTMYVPDPKTNHCYFTSRRRRSFSDDEFVCGTQSSGHPVTFVDKPEVDFVGSNLPSEWPEGARYWVGLSRAAPHGAYSSAATNEPGWDPPDDCSGCFGYGVTGAIFPGVDAGPEAGSMQAVVATNVSSSSTTMEVMGQNAEAEVVCEREPVGSRSVACNQGSYCFNVFATGKNYLFNPNPMNDVAAEAYCHALTDGGTSSLVVFGNRREREQVVYELNQLSQLPTGPGLAPFWIGLSTREVSRGSGVDASGQDFQVVWYWDDGEPVSPSSTASRPPPWGDKEPTSTSYPARAYVQFSGAYDTGLARVRTNPAQGQPLAFVCQF